MIHGIAKVLLKLLGFGKIAPFFEGLIQIGQPGTVAFPKELFGQGLGIILSGLNNTLAFQSNPDWIWPMWYERQRSADSPSFVPTGMNLLTTNITHRNWTSLGNPGRTLEIMVDPVGMVTMGPGEWSLLPFLRVANHLFVPSQMDALSVQQRFLNQNGSSLETKFPLNNKLAWKMECEVLVWEGEELALISQEVENLSSQFVRCNVGCSLRPYNTLNVSHIHRIKYQDRLWRINRKAALWLLDDPDRIMVGDRKGRDPIYLVDQESSKRKISSRSGVAAGSCEWELELKPWSKKTITVVATLRKSGQKSFPIFQRPTYESINHARTLSEKEQWVKDTFKGNISIPNPKWNEAWKTIRSHMQVFDDGDRFTPGTFLYHELWIRDSAFISMLHTELGAHKSVAPKLIQFLELQDRKGFFCSQTGEWDSNGQAIFTMMNHVLCSGDRKILEKCYPAIRAGAQWIGKQCALTGGKASLHRGLLPAGFSAEHFGPNDHYFWDNFWAIKGLEDAAWAAAIIGDQDTERWMNSFAMRLRLSMQQAIRTTVSRNIPRGLPSSPYRKVDSASIGNLVAVSPLGLVSATEPWVRQTVETLWEESICQGMFFQKIVHTGLNVYLSIQLARVFLALDDSRWKTVLQSVLDHASFTFTWPEAIHPRTGGGCMGDGDHGWAAAEVLSFMTSILVRVQDGVLLLGFGIPEDWYGNGKRIVADQICTRYGTISWSIDCKGDTGELQWKMERNDLQKRIPAVFRLPAPLGFSHPRLSGFTQSQVEYTLPTDEGKLEIPLKVISRGV